MSNTVKATIVLTAPQAEYLEKESDRLGVSVAELIRRIVDKHRGE